MPFRLFFLAVVIVLLVVFIGFNIENRCNVSFVFHTLENVPVVVTILSSFALGLVAALPFALRRRNRTAAQPKAPRGRKAKAAAPGGDATRDERFPEGGAGVP